MRAEPTESLRRHTQCIFVAFLIGGEFTFLNLDVSFTDDVLASYRQNYRGAIAFVGVHF